MSSPQPPLLSILALHYWAGSGRAFDLLPPLLPPGTRLLAPDLPGFGPQAAPAGFDYSLAAYVAWVASYLSNQNLTGYTLLGHSMGGKIALALAAQRPPGLQRLVLLSPSPPGGEPMSAAARQCSLAAFGQHPAAEAAYRRIVQRPLPAAIHQQVVADNLRSTAPAWDEWLLRGSREDLAALMPRLAVPCRLLVGQHDRAIAPGTQRRLTLPLLPPGTRLPVVAGAGHLLPLEAPEAVAQAIVSGL